MILSLNDPTLLKTQGYLNGEWVNGSEESTFPVFNPATGEEITQVANMSSTDVHRAIDKALVAMKQWQKKTAKERSIILRRWYDLVIHNQEDLAVIMTAEQGKVLAESRGEVAYGASFIEWFAEEAKRVYGDMIPAPQSDCRAIVIKQPVGVVAAITPWNFPNAMITRKAAPALAAGCAIVIKPAQETPLSALALAELAHRAGLPSGLLNILPSKNSRAIGVEMTSNPIVKKFSFTGSTPVGKTLMKQCSDTVKRMSMELGGNAPIIIFDDADLDRAVAGAAASKYRNSGQTCICINRILVQDTIYDAFVEKFTALVKTFKVGNGLDEDSTHGPVVNQHAVEDIQSLVDDALAKGAVAVEGGQPSEQGGCFYKPTILTQVNDQMRVFHEEVFGPVAPIISFSSEEEAIAMANDTAFGLASYIYTRDLARAWRVSEAIEYGMVGINETAITSEVIPFGGIKESGQGREGSKYGLDDYLEIKYICMGGLET